MSNDRASPGLSRRRFLGGAVILLCAAPGCGSAETTAKPPPQKIGPWVIPDGATLTAARYASLAALFDVLIPGDDASPGATVAEAAYYLDQLLGAFESDPPRIFAGGPTSGRHGGQETFSHFQRLTRVEEIRWRTYLEGSRGLPEREFNGPVKGLVTIYEEGLDALEKAAQDYAAQGFALLAFDDRKTLVNTMDAAFRDVAYGHAVEGTYGDPVYGGNRDEAGWKAIFYEGDRQPIGFTAHEMLHPEEG